MGITPRKFWENNLNWIALHFDLYNYVFFKYNLKMYDNAFNRYLILTWFFFFYHQISTAHRHTYQSIINQ